MVLSVWICNKTARLLSGDELVGMGVKRRAGSFLLILIMPGKDI